MGWRWRKKRRVRAKARARPGTRTASIAAERREGTKRLPAEPHTTNSVVSRRGRYRRQAENRGAGTVAFASRSATEGNGMDEKMLARP